MRPSFLFICTGNICRSPLAEAAMRKEASQRGLTIDIASAGIDGWHVGDPPDERAQHVAAAAGLEIGQYRARRLEDVDFTRYTHILALDTGHLRALKRLAPPDARDKIHLLMDFLPGQKNVSVEDPYYKDMAAFEKAWAQISSACAALARSCLDRGENDAETAPRS